MSNMLGIYIDENWNLKSCQREENKTCSICKRTNKDIDTSIRNFSIPMKDDKLDFSICFDCLSRIVILYNMEEVRERGEEADTDYNYAKEKQYSWDFYKKHIKKHKKNT